MLEHGGGILRLEIRHGMRAAFVADQQRVAVGEVARVGGLAMRRDETAIGVLRLAGRDALGDDPAGRVLAEMNHLGAGIDLLAAVRDRDRVELAARIVAAQDAARIFPGDGRAGLDLGPGNLRILAAAIAALGDEVVDAALALGVARIPVLHGRIFDLGVFERDELDHRGMQLVLVAHRRGAAFEIAHVRALVGDDQRALELAGILLVDAEIGRQFHRAAHARRHVDERAVGEHRRIQRRKEVIGHRHDRADIFLHQIGMLAQRLRDRHEDHAGLFQLFLERGRDRDGIEHGVDRDAPLAFRAHDAGQHFLLAQRNAELLVGAQDFRIDFVERIQRRLLLRRGIVIIILKVDLRIIDARPGRLAHGQPAAKGFEPPFQHPFRLVLLRRDEADGVFVQALRGLVGFDDGLEPIFVLVNVDTSDLIDGLLYGRHLSLFAVSRTAGWMKSVMVVRVSRSVRLCAGSKAAASGGEPVSLLT